LFVELPRLLGQLCLSANLLCLQCCLLVCQPPCRSESNAARSASSRRRSSGQFGLKGTLFGGPSLAVMLQDRDVLC